MSWYYGGGVLLPTVTLVGSKTSTGGYGTTADSTLSQAVSGGMLLVICVADAGSVPSGASCTDNAVDGSNTYTNQQAVCQTGNSVCIASFSAPIVNALASGKVVSVASLPNGDWQAWVYHITAVTSYDVGASKTSSAATNHDTGTTAAIAGGNSVTLWVDGSRSLAPNDTTAGGIALNTVTINNRYFATLYKIVTSGTQQGTYTTAGSVVSAACIHVLKP